MSGIVILRVLGVEEEGRRRGGCCSGLVYAWLRGEGEGCEENDFMSMRE